MNKKEARALEAQRYEEAEKVKKRQVMTLKAEFAPSVLTSWRVFVILQVVSAIYNYIGDCDEVFNYWEPTHYRLHDFGLQTWEYSPTYALRSYLFLVPLQLVGAFMSYMEASKIVQFYTMRVVLGIFTAASQTFFYQHVKSFFRPRVAYIMLSFMVVSPAMFVAGTAYLPSTFAMNCIMIACGFWLRSKPVYPAAIGFVALAAILGWPFAALAGLPLFISAISEKGCPKTFALTIFIGTALTIVTTAFDSLVYESLEFPALNIVMYNVFGGSGGSGLYGTEPWYWYIKNLLLNYNFVFIFAVASLPLVLLSSSMRLRVKSFKKTLGLLAIMYLWVVFFSLVPHKEERFMFVIYGPLALAGALGFVALFDFLFSFFSFCCSERAASRFVGTVAFLLALSVLLLSLSRTYALSQHFQAPLSLYGELSASILEGDDCWPGNEAMNVCVGQEWYRYPSSFFLPGNRFRLAFIEHGRTGQLPQAFNGDPAVAADNFNDRNEEEHSRYIPVEDCAWIVDYDPEGEEGPHAKEYEAGGFELLISLPFLEVSRTPSKFPYSLLRSFHVPGFSHMLGYGSYALYQSQELRRVKESVVFAECKGLVSELSAIEGEPLSSLPAFMAMRDAAMAASSDEEEEVVVVSEVVVEDEEVTEEEAEVEVVEEEVEVQVEEVEKEIVEEEVENEEVVGEGEGVRESEVEDGVDIVDEVEGEESSEEDVTPQDDGEEGETEGEEVQEIVEDGEGEGEVGGEGEGEGESEGEEEEEAEEENGVVNAEVGEGEGEEEGDEAEVEAEAQAEEGEEEGHVDGEVVEEEVEL